MTLIRLLLFILLLPLPVLAQTTGSFTGYYGPYVAPACAEACVLAKAPAAWWRAEDIAGNGDGSAVSSWTDRSGNSKNATQETADNQPSLQTAEINGKAVIRFDGTNDYLNFTDVSAASGTIFAVVKPTNLTNNAMIIFNNTNIQLRLNSSTGYVLLYAGTSATSTTGLASGAAQILSVSYVSNTSTAFFKNGASIGSVGSPGTSGAWDTIGAYLPGPSNAFVGDIAEIIIFSSTLSTSDRQDVETYLSNYYGISLS